MTFTLLSSQKKQTYDISWIEVDTSEGNFIILQDHVPTMLAILPHRPITICLTNGKQETFVTPGGILEISRSSALLLLNE